MHPLTGARLAGTGTSHVDLALEAGYSARLYLLDAHLARLLITRPGGLVMPRTWSISPEIAWAGDPDPIDGRDRLDASGFPGVPFSVDEDEAAIMVETAWLRVRIRRSPLMLDWQVRSAPDAPFESVLKDRPSHAYAFDRRSNRFRHYLVRDERERFYGFGDKSGDADKHGRRLAMGATDPLGYDGGRSDPLYKHIPWSVTVRPDRGGQAVGLFYDNLARGAFDLGQELDAYHDLFRSFEACDGDLDLYVVLGPGLGDVVRRFTALTGRAAFPPRWTIPYSGSTMSYTDAPDASDKLVGFLDLLARHGIPCGSFQMSSGYTLVGDKRCVFTWNRDRFPDPQAVTARFRDAQVELVANIKPALLLEHPRFDEVEAFGGFVRDSEDPSKPHVTQFWGGPAAYLDFTNPKTSAWWSQQVKEQLIDYGINSTWNDNNEFEIWDEAALCDLSGHKATIATLRPVQTNLMMRASAIAQTAAAPGTRPYLISRSGGPGMQRYVQTWSGDNRTNWETLRWNLRMGHGFSLSGLANFGHDIGGFAGPKPEPELFLRWIEQGIFWPRFTIHSWNDDGSANEPWMYPELLPQIRTCLAFRERLTPLFYDLLWRMHRDHEPILRPLTLDFPDQADSYTAEDAFLLGERLLVAPVLDKGATLREVWLPACAEGWFDLWTGAPHPGGRTVTVEAPLGRCPAFLRGGSILPLGPASSTESGPLTLRLALADGESARLDLYDDDGASVLEPPLTPPCLFSVEAEKHGGVATVAVSFAGTRAPRWPELRFEDAAGQPLKVRLHDGGLSERLSLPAGAGSSVTS
ncbi:TIM-barrel domain-containing protein [Bosea sp. (in: a-proteobacteria)]|uniref:glycoside hydrolase family 31 protein n=1 Tax=Bosea sp. (in: a-proteobacteria) TaxID=1871050 RepID=UPI002B46B89E|nr:TIM-barrel domain-containing protein [Bosea sp. (in: a-proteobacteria)]WRH58382.1 MAG: glycoside hydrolase family 31 protein [Bosea sp. (in: a-proteobacteria)]